MGLRFPQGNDGCQTTEGCKLWLAQKSVAGACPAADFLFPSLYIFKTISGGDADRTGAPAL